MDPCLKKKIFWMAVSYTRRNKASYQDIAEQYGVSKSTVTKYFNEYLPKLFPILYGRVKAKAARNVLKNQYVFGKKQKDK